MEKTVSKKSKSHVLGHRVRLRTKFLLDNGHSFQDYELLELILTAAIIRIDVKELAKNLILHFGSFTDVFRAKPSELLAAGAPKSAVIYIKVLFCISQRLSSIFLKENNITLLSNTDYIIEFGRMLINTITKDQIIIAYLNAELRLLYKETLPKSILNAKPENLHQITQTALKYKTNAIIVIEKSNKDDIVPTNEDKKNTIQMVELFNKIHIRYIERIIITPSTYVSFRDYNIIS